MTTPSVYIDITNKPELIRLAEDIATTNAQHALVRNNKTLAIISPVSTRKKHKKTMQEHAASLAAIGSWRDLDADTLLTSLYATRTQGSRPLSGS